MPEIDPLSALANDISRLIAVYHNRQQLFVSKNGTVTGFEIKDVVRAFLYSRFENDGLIPIPNFRFEDWIYDIIGMKEFQIVLAVVIRNDQYDDYRHLTLLPNKVNKILLALTPKAIPNEIPEGITILKVPHKPTEAIKINLPIRSVISDYCTAFKNSYQIKCPYTNSQLIEAASKMSIMWTTQGSPYKFLDYCEWAMAFKKGTQNIEFMKLGELLNREMIAQFKKEKERKNYNGQWTTQGWSGLS